MAAPSFWFEGFPDQITAEDYAALPEEFCKTIEVIDGHVVKCESPSRVHNRVALNLAVAFKAGRKPEPCLMVDTDIDVRIAELDGVPNGSRSATSTGYPIARIRAGGARRRAVRVAD